MEKIKSKNFKMASIVFVILWFTYIGIWYISQSIINQDKICHNHTCFILATAEDSATREQWLMYRESLATNRGMLFIFEEEKKHVFWMKNTFIPLDMIRINKDLEIVDIQTAQPCKDDICQNYVPAWNSNYVLEINAGLSQEYGISIWDKFELILKRKGNL